MGGVAEEESEGEAGEKWRGQREDGDIRERVIPRYQAEGTGKVGKDKQYSFLCSHQGIEIQRVKINLRQDEQKE